MILLLLGGLLSGIRLWCASLLQERVLTAVCQAHILAHARILLSCLLERFLHGFGGFGSGGFLNLVEDFGTLCGDFLTER